MNPAKKDWAEAFLDAVVTQDRTRLRSFFHPNAAIRWPCSNEAFNLDSYLSANCDYPGDWRGALEQVEETGDGLVTAARVWAVEGEPSFHVASFFRLDSDGKIVELTEYWGDDGPPPPWRQGIGHPLV